MLKRMLPLAFCLGLSACVVPITVATPSSPQPSASPSASSSTAEPCVPPAAVHGGVFDYFELPPPCAASGWSQAQLNTAASQDWSQEEKDILTATNMLRQHPGQFADDFLLPIVTAIKAGKRIILPGNLEMFAVEGLSAVQEAYDVLKATPELTILTPDAPMRRSALQHVQDQGPSGQVGHSGSDGSSLESRLKTFSNCFNSCGENISYGEFPHGLWHVVGLVVDDDVRDRGHRKNLLQSRFRAMGVSCGPHKVYGSMCVQDFTG